MKLTKQQLKQIIKEELGRVMSEVRFEDIAQTTGLGGRPDSPETIAMNQAARNQENSSDEMGVLVPQVISILTKVFHEHELDYDELVEELYLPDGWTEEDEVMIQYRKLRGDSAKWRIKELEDNIIDTVLDS